MPAPYSPEPSMAQQALFDRLDALADEGLFVQAHGLARTLGEYRDWRGPEAMTLAARLAAHLGAPRLADALVWLAYRRYPQAAQTRLRQARFLLARRGHYRAWRFLQSFGTWLPEDAGQRAEWLSFTSYLYALLRDFEHSARLHEEALACGGDHDWLRVERSYGLEQEDRYADALALCEQVLQTRPNYRAALVQAAQLHLQLGQDEAALALLRRGAQTMESLGVCAQLVDNLVERDHLEDASYWLTHMEGLSPLKEKQRFDWFAARRCDIACLRGEHALGLELARRAGGPFYRALQAHLAEPLGTRRLLSVSFVRQHHMTCVPATLTALSAYWGKPVEHLEVAEEICYDGTSHQAERAWAERNGWLAVEFTADWSTCRALLERGVPFTLTLQYTGSGHLQAVVGYDEPRGTLLVRDPGQAQYGECLADSLFQAQRASGPRGMLLLPPEQAHRLDGVALPDRDLWELYYRLNCALEVHRRADALAAYETLAALAPGHRLALQAQRALSWYDGREHDVLVATEALLALYPDDANLILSKAASLAQLQPRATQLDWLAAHCRQHWNDPAISLRYAELLGEDGRTREQVRSMLERVLRQAPTQARAWSALASQRWGEGLREEACLLYRLAACLHGANEGYSVQYFRALRCLGRTEEGLLFLQQRQARLGRLAAGPSVTLSDLLEELQRPHEAGAVLQQALQQRPADADLMLALADFQGRNGEIHACQALLSRAEPLSRRGAWLRAAVQHSQRSAGDVRQALDWAREAAELEPLSLQAHHLCVQLLEQVSGSEQADAYVEALVVEHPHHAGIGELQVERAQKHGPEAVERALRRLLDNHPHNAWALRELAGCLTRQGRRDEALDVCEQARLADPQSSYAYSTLGFVLLQDGRREAAREALRASMRCSADNEYASGMLIDTSDGREEARQALAQVHEELTRQVTFGDGWLAYEQQAQGLLDGEALLGQLDEALRQRPDLWQAWVAMARQQARLGRHEQAQVLLRGAIERFPMLPRLALEQARLQKSQGELDACCATLQDSFRINPLWTSTVSLYVDCLLEQGGRLEEAEQLLRRVLLRAPDDSELRAYLGYVLGEREDYAEGADQAERVLRDAPGHGWAWNQLGRYSEALGMPQRPLRLARELVARRAGDVEAWLALAQHESDPQAREQALREALRYSPRHRTANERLLGLLLEAGRHDDLRTLLDAPCWDGKPPVELALFGPRALQAEGEQARAVDALRQLLALHPDCYAGWRDLADGFDNMGEYPAYVDAARQMVRLEPGVAMAHGFLGHALLLDGQRQEALPAFRQAFELDADYLFAGFNAFDLTRELLGEVHARAFLDQLLQKGDEPGVWRRALDLARATGDRELQRRALTFLASEAQAEDAWEEDVGTHPRQDPILNAVLKQGLAAGTLHVAAVETWLWQRARSPLSNLALQHGFRKALANDPRDAAKCAMFRLLGKLPHARRILLGSTLKTCRQAIAGNAEVWGAASYALIESKRYHLMFQWLADWRRPDTPSWALDNLALGYRFSGMDAEAGAVSRLSLEREPNNHDAMLWLAVDAALADDLDTLEAWLARLEGVSLRDLHGALLSLVRGYVSARREGANPGAVRHFQEAEALAAKHSNPPFWRVRRILWARLGIATGPAWLEGWSLSRLLRVLR